MVQQSPPASTSGTGTASGDVRLSGGVIATLAGSGLLIVFMLQNTQDVTLEFLFWGFTWPLWLFTPGRRDAGRDPVDRARRAAPASSPGGTAGRPAGLTGRGRFSLPVGLGQPRRLWAADGVGRLSTPFRRAWTRIRSTVSTSLGPTGAWPPVGDTERSHGCHPHPDPGPPT